MKNNFQKSQNLKAAKIIDSLLLLEKHVVPNIKFIIPDGSNGEIDKSFEFLIPTKMLDASTDNLGTNQSRFSKNSKRKKTENLDTKHNKDDESPKNSQY